MIKINFIGTSHGFPDAHRQCSSTFITVSGNTYIIDAGCDIGAAININDIPLESIKGVFITHPHGDHLNGIHGFCDFITWYKPFHVCQPKFMFPDKACIIAIEAWRKFITDKHYYLRPDLDFNVYSEGVIFDDGVLKVTAVKTQHIERSYAFILEAEGKRLFFSGDMIYNLSEYPAILGEEHYDLVVCETAHHDLGTINEKLLETNTDFLVMNHVNPEREQALKVVNPPFKFMIAKDGDIVEI